MKKMFSSIIYEEKMLLLRAQLIKGFNIIDIARWLNYKIPKNINKDKGIMGKLIEFYLIGKHQNNKSNQDLPYLGIEIKTITINKKNKVINDNFICSFSLINENNFLFYKSKLYNKISKILWIPIIKNINIPFFMNKIGKAFLWKPSNDDKIKLFNDWNNLTKLLILGQINNINSYNGYILLVKNKSNKKKLTKAIDKNGKIIFVTPKSFYFKKNFLNFILKNKVNFKN
ncbi:hypothetical protein GJT89_02045 [Enterobacteriaceae endosymbiont of Donacia versicolorea]|uniref:MutH/Sau3AI family endonuclease n=1 Tax=Enterobacteriaceae endosymbiont of Donacia versicolorea TaxID=2675788 RepID=UPI0014492C65|nr:MutH/Sau3AI family endonuclease [Enterobacteriaceae endosymbiont of Donacia versicolorea]QJC32252.1 hypothetical protein GJT89_02045 [Enterobacteriaceae endosymbiont of Donacia versicolorea]